MTSHERETSVGAPVLQRARSDSGSTKVPATEPKGGTGYNPVAGVMCRVGDGSCADGHVAALKSTPVFLHATSPGQRAKTTIDLQRNYGNRFTRQVMTAMRGDAVSSAPT
jgi:hypothetical protein